MEFVEFVSYPSLAKGHRLTETKFTVKKAPLFLSIER